MNVDLVVLYKYLNNFGPPKVASCVQYSPSFRVDMPLGKLIPSMPGDNFLENFLDNFSIYIHQKIAPNAFI